MDEHSKGQLFQLNCKVQITNCSSLNPEIEKL